MSNHCPECNSVVEEGVACLNCGLILSTVIREDVEAPRRRREDLSEQKRRATDVTLVPCRFCRGEIPHDAIRCRHCSQIVDDTFYASMMARRRSQVNYASWVAYILGLLAFLVAKPVGLIAIGAGLLLSIAYYAIPVERLPARGDKVDGAWLTRFLRQQFRFERVSVPVPHFPSRRLVFVGTPIVAALLGYFANFVMLQRPMNEILKGNDAFNGMAVTTHYEYWVLPGTIVYDLRAVSGEQTPLDVYAALLEYAQSKQALPFQRVELRFKGQPRFTIDGTTFRRLGREYEKKNYQWVLFEFPRLARPLPESASRPTAGEELLYFHRHWYADAAVDEKRAS